jgi:hypothetical protein
MFCLPSRISKPKIRCQIESGTVDGSEQSSYRKLKPEDDTTCSRESLTSVIVES